MLRLWIEQVVLSGGCCLLGYFHLNLVLSIFVLALHRNPSCERLLQELLLLLGLRCNKRGSKEYGLRDLYHTNFSLQEMVS